MATCQIGDCVKGGVHQSQGSMGSGPFPSSELAKLCSQYLHQASKSRYVTYFFEILKTEFM